MIFVIQLEIGVTGHRVDPMRLPQKVHRCPEELHRIGLATSCEHHVGQLDELRLLLKKPFKRERL